MKTFFAAAALAAALALAAHAQDDHKHSAPAQDKETAAADAAAVKRGEPIGDSPRVAFADVLKEPKKFAGKAVVIEGSVERVCQAEGCWMQIRSEEHTSELQSLAY